MLGFFNTTVANAFVNAKTKFDATGVSGAFANAKSVLSDMLSEESNPKTSIAEIAKTQIEEIEVFLTTETETKLNAFIENHKSVVDVINAFKVNIKSLNGDTNLRIECSYYETYEDIGNNKITKSILTLSEAEEKRALQKTYCDKLFEDNAIELRVISNHLQTISKNINSLLQKISENRYNTNTVNELTTLRSKLQEYNFTLLKYIIVLKCGENGIKGLLPSKRLVGGGSYKKTKGYKKINALNRGMRGGGIYDVISTNALIVKVDNQITVLEAFEQRQSQNIKVLGMLIYKRGKLYKVIERLNANINALHHFYNTSQTPYKVDYSYY